MFESRVVTWVAFIDAPWALAARSPPRSDPVQVQVRASAMVRTPDNAQGLHVDHLRANKDGLGTPGHMYTYDTYLASLFSDTRTTFCGEEVRSTPTPANQLQRPALGIVRRRLKSWLSFAINIHSLGRQVRFVSVEH